MRDIRSARATTGTATARSENLAERMRRTGRRLRPGENNEGGMNFGLAEETRFRFDGQAAIALPPTSPAMPRFRSRYAPVGAYVFVVLAALLQPSWAPAQSTYVWNKYNGGVWSDPSSWLPSPGSAPTADTTLQFRTRPTAPTA